MSERNFSNEDDKTDKFDYSRFSQDESSCSSYNYGPEKVSMRSLIVWNIDKAIEQKPNLDLKAALNTTKERLESHNPDITDIIPESPHERHLTCALLAWQQIGHKNVDSLMGLIQPKHNQDDQQTVSTNDEKDVKDINFHIKDTSEEFVFEKEIPSAANFEPKVPFLSETLNRNSTVRYPNKVKVYACDSTSMSSKIEAKVDQACGLDETCKDSLRELEKATQELKNRAVLLACRETARAELLERAETAWKDLEMGYERRLRLALEKEESYIHTIPKLVEESNQYKVACGKLLKASKERHEIAESQKVELAGIEKKLCDLCCQRQQLAEEDSKLDCELAELQTKAAQLLKDFHFKEDQIKRKMQILQNEIETENLLTCEAERATCAELQALQEAINNVSDELKQEDATNKRLIDELQKLKDEKADMLKDLDKCKEACDFELKTVLEKLDAKKEELDKLKDQVVKCKCKQPVDVVVEVKRTPSFAAFCACPPDHDPFDENCSCTTLKSRLLLDLIRHLFGGLQSELGDAGINMPCQLLKCLEDGHNWEKPSIVKTNLRNFFAKLLLGELEIAIATCLEKYHAKWVSKSCVDKIPLCPGCARVRAADTRFTESNQLVNYQTNPNYCQPLVYPVHNQNARDLQIALMSDMPTIPNELPKKSLEMNKIYKETQHIIPDKEPKKIFTQFKSNKAYTSFQLPEKDKPVAQTVQKKVVPKIIRNEIKPETKQVLDKNEKKVFVMLNKKRDNINNFRNIIQENIKQSSKKSTRPNTSMFMNKKKLSQTVNVHTCLVPNSEEVITKSPNIDVAVSTCAIGISDKIIQKADVNDKSQSLKISNVPSQNTIEKVIKVLSEWKNLVPDTSNKNGAQTKSEHCVEMCSNREVVSKDKFNKHDNTIINKDSKIEESDVTKNMGPVSAKVENIKKSSEQKISKLVNNPVLPTNVECCAYLTNIADFQPSYGENKDSSEIKHEQNIDPYNFTNASLLSCRPCEYNIELLGVSLGQGDLLNQEKLEFHSIPKTSVKQKTSRIACKPRDSTKTISKNETLIRDIPITDTNHTLICHCCDKMEEIKQYFNDTILKLQNHKITSTDKALNVQSLLEFDKPSRPHDSDSEKIVVDSVYNQDLEINTFDMLKEHLRDKFADIKNISNNLCDISREEEEEIYSSILLKVKRILSNNTNKLCDCKKKANTGGSWTRAYLLMREYLKTKIKRVQCMCASPTTQIDDQAQAELFDKVYEMIENDFYRLKKIYHPSNGEKCEVNIRNYTEGGENVNEDCYASEKEKSLKKSVSNHPNASLSNKTGDKSFDFECEYIINLTQSKQFESESSNSTGNKNDASKDIISIQKDNNRYSNHESIDVQVQEKNKYIQNQGIIANSIGPSSPRSSKQIYSSDTFFMTAFKKPYDISSLIKNVTGHDYLTIDKTDHIDFTHNNETNIFTKYNEIECEFEVDHNVAAHELNMQIGNVINDCDNNQDEMPLENNALGPNFSLGQISTYSNCDCQKVPLCHIKMLMEHIESKLISSNCTCDTLDAKACPMHSHTI